MISVWSDNCELSSFDKLDCNIKTDVLIIGGGMAGILCAYMLKESQIDYTLVEAETICCGITKNTTAKITSQHGFIYSKIASEYGLKWALKYLMANQAALNKYVELCKSIKCDFERTNSFVYSKDEKKIDNELSILNKIGERTIYLAAVPMPIKTAGAVGFKNQAQFNPLKFTMSIAKGLNIYENTCVREIKGSTAITDNATIQAKKIIIATHFPFVNKHGSYFLKMYQHRSYVIALENAHKINGMYVDEANIGMSFRSYNDLLLLGGGGHRTGKKGGAWAELETFAKMYYPGSSIKYRWATQDCMTLDGIPYIGQYSKNTPDLYVATGFNKWGMTSSMVSATILTDIIKGKDNEFTDVFSPSRTIIHSQLAVNSFEAVKNLLSISKKRCSHLGCALKWNKFERTWDCPCHGSRFEETGELIDNPATNDLKNNK